MRTAQYGLALMIGSIALGSAREPDTIPLPPRMISLKSAEPLNQVAGDLTRQTGFQITVDPALASKPIAAQPKNAPFWTVLESIARQSDGRIVMSDAGSRIRIEPRGASRDVSSIAGPFRTVARRVACRYDLDTGTVIYTLQLEAHWELRFPVFRLSSTPQITKAVDDRGTALSASGAKAFAQPIGWSHTLEAVRLTGLTRDSRAIAEIRGTYTVTASERMMAFRFDDLTGQLPLRVPAQSGVPASLRRIEKDENVWELEVELTYPAGQPHFESFEEAIWLSRNRMQLIPPGGGKALMPNDYQILESGRRVVAVYRFKEDAMSGPINPRAKGWSVVYESPAPLVEFDVPFELRDIPLP